MRVRDAVLGHAPRWGTASLVIVHLGLCFWTLGLGYDAVDDWHLVWLQQLGSSAWSELFLPLLTQGDIDPQRLRPVFWLGQWAKANLYGPDPLMHHLHAVVVGAACVVLVEAILRRLSGSRQVSCGLTLLLITSAYTTNWWIPFPAEIDGTLLFLLGCRLHLAVIDGKGGSRAACALLALCLASLHKETFLLAWGSGLAVTVILRWPPAVLSRTARTYLILSLAVACALLLLVVCTRILFHEASGSHVYEAHRIGEFLGNLGLLTLPFGSIPAILILAFLRIASTPAGWARWTEALIAILILGLLSGLSLFQPWSGTSVPSRYFVLPMLAVIAWASSLPWSSLAKGPVFVRWCVIAFILLLGGGRALHLKFTADYQTHYLAGIRALDRLREDAGKHEISRIYCFGDPLRGHLVVRSWVFWVLKDPMVEVVLVPASDARDAVAVATEHGWHAPSPDQIELGRGMLRPARWQHEIPARLSQGEVVLTTHDRFDLEARRRVPEARWVDYKSTMHFLRLGPPWVAERTRTFHSVAYPDY